MRPALKVPIHIHFRALDIYLDVGLSLVLSTREAKAENNDDPCTILYLV